MAGWAMTDGEISNSYRLAADKAAQIRVLAELCAVSIPVMKQKIVELGFDLPRKTRKPAVRMDRARAVALYEAGCTDKAIATTLGVSEAAVRAWRIEQHFPVRKRRTGE